MINLVAFDVCDVNNIRVTRQADPLNYVVTCPLSSPIHDGLHTQLRKTLKAHAKGMGVLLGRASFSREVRLAVYKKTLRPTAYVHGDSPQDKRS